MFYPVKPSFLIKSIWFTGGAAAAYAAYYATFKDLWAGAKNVRCGGGPCGDGVPATQLRMVGLFAGQTHSIIGR